ncbi:cupin domain-containing protein [Tianweitania sp. BSSL-BM11]|uniref:Cupin domain-containing protein n=1 Tax=Tianweitania aestuarii TaxID=2814886 RepID=A0ABS5RWK8_9HYPH|nr:cupin domain-containing protein [Tianweitania aestuarii]MBS9721399.1 cupin domain-containing protein [Tianweitania aestuarii]
MTQPEAGITQSGTSIDGIVWNILGQTYVPKHHYESSMSWHATFPPGTFVPPHIHTTQDEFIYMLEGRFDLLLDDKEVVAGPGDLICLPRNIVHGIFNKSDQTVKCIFWVSPSAKLWDLFTKIHNVGDPEEVVRIASAHEVQFLPPPSE